MAYDPTNLYTDCSAFFDFQSIGMQESDNLPVGEQSMNDARICSHDAHVQWTADPIIQQTQAQPQDTVSKLSLTPNTTEQELLTVESMFSEYIESLARNTQRMPFIHPLHLQPFRVEHTLDTLMRLAQLYTNKSPESEKSILETISQEVQFLYSKVMFIPCYWL
jgi:hypothetical protein